MCPKPFKWAKNKRKPFSDRKSRGPLLAGAALNSVYSQSNLTKPYLASQILSNHLASIAQSVIIFESHSIRHGALFGISQTPGRRGNSPGYDRK